MKNKYRIIVAICLVFIVLKTKAQNTTFNNVSIGTDYPGYGVAIKSNFPGYSGVWGRGFFVTNETGGQPFFTFASIGTSVNGISSVTSSFIGKDLDNRYMTFLPNGNIGIGTPNPRANLDMAKDISNGQLGTVFGRLPEGDGTGLGTYLGVKGYVTQGSDSNNIKSFSIVHDFYGQTNSSINFFRGQGMLGGFMAFNTSDNTEKMRIAANGNIGIGTTNPTSKLTVAGNINSREVKVTVDAGADFVFAADYALPSLDSVHQYIKENKHLPEIASALEMKKDGINLSEMNIKLLQKVEELTLYMIEQNKKMDLQQKENALQSEQIEEQNIKIMSLQKKINNLK